MAPFICNKTCQLITRLVFLTFIIVIGTYFFWSNEKRPASTPTPLISMPKPPQENFQNSLSENDIRAIFKETMNRDPTSQEVSFYVDYAAKKPNMTRGQLTDMITTTAPMLSANLEQDAKEVQNRFNYEFIITETFNHLLDRNPTSIELDRYVNLFQTDAEFTKEKLEFILMTSDEYIRLQKAQTNEVYATLPGNMTDRQLTLKVTTLYQSTTGSAYIDEDTMRFLKKKYIEFNMSDDKMREFIKNYVAGTPPPQSGASGGGTATTTTVSPKTGASAAGTAPVATKSGAAVGASGTPGSAAPKTGTPTTSTSVAPSGEESTFQTGSGNYYEKATIYNIFTVGTNSYMGVPTNIKQITQAAQSAGSCKVNPSLNSELNNLKSTAYSDFINARNMDGMASTCARNKRYQDVEDDFASVFYTNRFTPEDMVLDPSLAWSVPQQHPPACTNGNCKVETLHEQSALIGTPLSDAKDTMVGSILPPFPPS